MKENLISQSKITNIVQNIQSLVNFKFITILLLYSYYFLQIKLKIKRLKKHIRFINKIMIQKVE
jgi:hypothetical protein